MPPCSEPGSHSLSGFPRRRGPARRHSNFFSTFESAARLYQILCHRQSARHLLRLISEIHFIPIHQLAIFKLLSPPPGAQLTDQDDAPVGARHLRLCSISCQPEDNSSITERAFLLLQNPNHKQIDTCRFSLHIYKPVTFPSSHQFLAKELSSFISTPHSEKLPRNSIQHGRDESRDRCVRRGAGAGRQILGSSDGTVSRKLQDQSTSRPHASTHRQGIRYSQGSGGYGQHDIWTWYASYRQVYLNMSSRIRQTLRLAKPSSKQLLRSRTSSSSITSPSLSGRPVREHNRT